MSLEEIRSNNFVSKPSGGWMHSDKALASEGVQFTVRYIGCLDVKASMKSLDFDTRSMIAKECINQVCEAAGLKFTDKRTKNLDRRVNGVLGSRPRLEHAGSDVLLIITSTCLKMKSLDTGDIFAVHDMPNISFASGGDSTMMDFIAYVAKDESGRACFILECETGFAQDVIATIGQAFELRYREFIQKQRPQLNRQTKDDPEYYNDLPEKVPPDTSNQMSTGKLSNQIQRRGVKSKEPPSLILPLSSISDRELSINLIDFEAPTPPAFGPTVQRGHLESFLLSQEELCTNNNVETSTSTILSVGTGLGLPNSPSQPQPPKDPFDMQPFASTFPKPLTANQQRLLLEREEWFHGCISRNQAESLVHKDGDFLVRESQTTPGQFVLTGLQNGTPKHLLLVDPEGVIRTKDQAFESVIHLIRHHKDNSVPIVWAETSVSLVLLRNPISRAH